MIKSGRVNDIFKVGLKPKQIDDSRHLDKNSKVAKRYEKFAPRIVYTNVTYTSPSGFTAYQSSFSGNDADSRIQTDEVLTFAPSAEIICVQRVATEVKVCLFLQSRVPYTVKIDNKEYVDFFVENLSGVLNRNESYAEGALRTVVENLDYEIKDFRQLIKPTIYRNTRFTNSKCETFIAVLGQKKPNHHNKHDYLQALWFPIDFLEKEFENYLEGNIDDFLGFNISEMTLLSLQRFFIKYRRGEIKF